MTPNHIAYTGDYPAQLECPLCAGTISVLNGTELEAIEYHLTHFHSFGRIVKELAQIIFQNRLKEG